MVSAPSAALRTSGGLRGEPASSRVLPEEEPQSSVQARTGAERAVTVGLVRRLRGIVTGAGEPLTAHAVDRLRAVDPRVVDWLLAIVVATLLQVHLALADQPGQSLANLIGGLLLALPLAWRRRAPLAVVVGFVGVAVLNETLSPRGLFAGSPPLLASLAAAALVFYSVGAYAESRPAVAGATIGVAGLWTTVIVSGEVDVQSFLFSAGLVVASPWLAGRTARSRHLRAAAIEREREQREQLAVGDERARIARELHDVVAHSVGVMVVQAQGARRVLDGDPDRAREALGAIEHTGRTALEEMRRSLGVLRRDGAEAALTPQPGMDGLGALVEHTRRGGLTVEVTLEGEPRPLPQGVDLSAYRIVQEALTNAVKHASGAHARVTVRYGEHDLELEVADDGSGASVNGSRRGSGHGLVGMRERVALYGGEVRAGPGPEGGFVVRASLPLTP